MVNVTYGALSPGSTDGDIVFNPLGTDIVATLDTTTTGETSPIQVPHSSAL
jgi:hypothetical protein